MMQHSSFAAATIVQREDFNPVNPSPCACSSRPNVVYTVLSQKVKTSERKQMPLQVEHIWFIAAYGCICLNTFLLVIRHIRAAYAINRC